MGQELTTRQMQMVSLEILKKVADWCQELNLRYCLAYGTLIGAIRHKGFIPWDDDVDIMMPRPDYDKLLAFLAEHPERLGNLKVFNPQTCPQYPYMITRISDVRYHIVAENEEPYGLGVFIDIYPYDGLGNTMEEALRYGLKGDRLSSLCYQATRRRYAVETTTSTVRKLLKLPAFLVAKLCGKNIFQKKLESLARQKDYDRSEYVGCVVWLSGGKRDIFSRSWFDSYVEVPFEKYVFRVPEAYDKVLRHFYGDYMQLPPENERIGHHYYKTFEN